MSRIPSGYQLRPAQKSDSPAIRRLIWKVGINPLGLKWPRFVLAVDENGRMTGCGQVKVHNDGSHELASIAVTPECRGLGIAGAIIRHLIAAHPGRLHLTCRTHLGKFYERFGFRLARTDELSPYFFRIHRLSGLLRFLRLMPTEGILFMLRD